MSGPRSSRKKRRRSIASSASVPNHSVLPAPSLNVENARVPDPSSSTTHTGIDGEHTPVIAPTWLFSLPDARPISPVSIISRARSRLRAQPSNRRGGDERAALRIGEPVRLDRRAGVDQRAALAQHRQDVARGGDADGARAEHASIRSTTARLASATVAPWTPQRRSSARDRLGIARRRRAPVDVDDRRVLVADRVAERHQPDVDDLHLVQHRLIKRHERPPIRVDVS